MKKELINECARLFDVHPRDLVGDSRLGFLMPARFALYKALRLRGWSYSAIGKAVGGRDHSTVMYGVKRAEYMMERDESYAGYIFALRDLYIEPPKWIERMEEMY